MVTVYGTSHVSEESIRLIEEKIEEHDPDVIAVELDPLRLDSLLNGSQESQGSIFIRLLEALQRHIGSKTGVFPGEEMLHAYRYGLERGNDIYLIDQDIRITVDRLRKAPRKEKARAVLETFTGFLLPGKFDISKIPEPEIIDELLEEMRERYPHLYRVLVEERNHVMSESLRQVKKQHPGEEIIAFVGAAHRDEIRKQLSEAR